ncbi:hypothetical protein GE09DRAFT_1210247 [Coniochaeta sp. 2T2.1]|nr:hypothetical protein GE09DRAFT_1210247 [Coniochaeta sp. 2T2.1]
MQTTYSFVIRAVVVGLFLMRHVASDIVTSTATSSVCPSACASDNCFRQLAGRTASASTFCGTFTTATTTAVTGFPTYVSASCGTSRVSSVCSCLWPPASTTSPLSTITAGDGTRTTVVSTTTVVACPPSLNLLSHGSNPCLSPWTSLDKIIENNVGDYTLRSVTPAGAPSTDGACQVSWNNTDQEAFAEYEFTHLFTLPATSQTCTLAFWAAAADSVSAAECYIIGSFASQSNERSFSPLSTNWKQFVMSYRVDPTDAEGWVAIVVVCNGNSGYRQWGVILDQVQFFASRP